MNTNSRTRTVILVTPGETSGQLARVSLDQGGTPEEVKILPPSERQLLRRLTTLCGLVAEAQC